MAPTPATSSADSADATPAPDLPALPVPDVRRTAAALWSERSLLEDLEEHAIRRLTREIVAAAEDLGVPDLAGLVERAQEIVEEVTGLSAADRGQFLKSPRVLEVQRVRNTLAALVASVAVAAEQDARPILAALPKLQAPQGGRTRILTGEEILLLRLHTLGLARHRRGHGPASQYMLVEAGARPSETTAVRPADFDNLHDPAAVALSGMRGYAKPRTVSLPAWCRPVMQQIMTAHLAQHETAATSLLAYHGTHPAGSHEASASASGNLSRAMRHAGIVHQPEATSILRWRIAHTEDTEGTNAAAVRSGYRLDPKNEDFKSLDRMRAFLGRRPEQAEVLNGPKSYAA